MTSVAQKIFIATNKSIGILCGNLLEDYEGNGYVTLI
jgi:hypothetical protein